MIKAIIFDCFGVLTTDGWLPFRNRHFTSDPELLQSATDLNKQVDAGIISYDSFIKQIAALAHVSTSEVRRNIESNVPNTALFEYIATELAPHYKLGILSNAGADWLSELFTAPQLSLFQARALSYEMGVTKPDPRTYQTIAERLQVGQHECLFIDDQERYCSGAIDAGMQAIHYRSFEQLVSDCTAKLAD